MTVENTFHLEDGRTVFVGPIETQSNGIPPCECEIVVGGEIRASLRIDGEEIPKGNRTPNRSVSTSERIDLAKYGIGRRGYKIRSKV